MSRPTIRTILACIATLAIATISSANPSKPNVVIILADDMGFSDAGCFGGEIQTPNIDRLAATGLRFTDFHNTARCWPSRAALLSGYYAQQVRRDAIPDFPVAAGSGGKRPAWARLLPELLKPRGYHSYHSGKWHVDGPRLPAGFEHSYAVTDYDRNFYPQSQSEDDVKLPPVKPGTDYYTSTAYADYAIKYLKGHAERHAGEPFMLYLAFTAPHFPLQAPAEDIARYKGNYDAGWDALREARWKRVRELNVLDCALPPREPEIIPAWNVAEVELQRRIGPGEVGHAVAWDSLTAEQKAFQAAKMEVHAAMVDRMDREIGRVLDQLTAMGVADNTLVFFLSDNGASAEQLIRGDGDDPAAPVGSAKSFVCLGPGWSTMCDAPLRLHKSWVHEGGMSTPLIVSWPKGIAARGELRRNVGHVIDLMPTILDVAGGAWPPAAGVEAKVPPPPGKSLVPAFTADGSVTHDFLWWYHEGHKAIRVGDLKAVSFGGKSPWELYDLKADRSEMKDLAGAMPGKVEELAERWQKAMDEYRELAMRDLTPAEIAAGKKKRAGAKAEPD